ncbi:MAG: synthase delta chain [Labilithrix sp.]|nr:synthase delta chain [Labilithrix sp.]
MIPGVIAKRYATALLEIGGDSGQLDALVDEVARAADAYDASAELRNAFENPLVPAAAKKAILGDIAERLDLGTTSRSFLGLLVDRRRIRALPAIATRLREMADLRRGITRAEVLTALPLSEEYFEKLQRELERITGRKVALDRKLDPSLICGVLVRIGDTVYDGSLVARLRQLKETMLPN